MNHKRVVTVNIPARNASWESTPPIINKDTGSFTPEKLISINRELQKPVEKVIISMNSWLA